MSHQTILWIIFAIVVPAALVLDLVIFHRRSRVVKLKEALVWCAVWISLALIFNIVIYFLYGHDKALTFLTAYLVEESLSVDNLFVFLMIFSYFAVPAIYQRKVLFWGILGAIIMRGIFIVTGLTLITRLHWIIYLFGAFLVFTGIRLSTGKDQEIHPEKNPVLRLARRFMPITHDYEGERFWVKKNGRRLFTPLFLVLLVIETTDIVFAVDSVPAVLSVTLDPLIVYTSNIFAILGLRSIFFVLAGIVQRLYYLHYGLSAILIFLGFKMLTSAIYKMPTGISLGVVAFILSLSVVASLLRPKKPEGIPAAARSVSAKENKESAD